MDTPENDLANLAMHMRKEYVNRIHNAREPPTEEPDNNTPIPAKDKQ